MGVRRCYICDAETVVMGTSPRCLEVAERQAGEGVGACSIWRGRAVGTGGILREDSSALSWAVGPERQVAGRGRRGHWHGLARADASLNEKLSWKRSSWELRGCGVPSSDGPPELMHQALSVVSDTVMYGISVLLITFSLVTARALPMWVLSGHLLE